ncbi:MAG: hypothetical protein IPL71_09055 [Anaerolineales bacterium]|uniref:hypothetical protein n=1 Tax=Candidatus Villigracilis proximus TaxID=3140683 RepID=UPI0031358EDA|nr:hypothetical protein [Anaerolineales bacterium]
MRVCILSDEDISSFNPGPYIKDFDWKMITMTAPVMDKIRALAESREFDVFLNVCEGYEFEDEEDQQIGYHAIEIVQALEALELPLPVLTQFALIRPVKRCKPLQMQIISAL